MLMKAIGLGKFPHYTPGKSHVNKHKRINKERYKNTNAIGSYIQFYFC